MFTQIEIAKTHGLPILPNKFADVVTHEEVEMIEEAAMVSGHTVHFFAFCAASATFAAGALNLWLNHAMS